VPSSGYVNSVIYTLQDTYHIIIGSILVEQGVENGLKTALKFFQNEIPYLKEYSLDSTLQIPSAGTLHY
jgi:hypothetical protein